MASALNLLMKQKNGNDNYQFIRAMNAPVLLHQPVRSVWAPGEREATSQTLLGFVLLSVTPVGLLRLRRS
jgi:hypothetical protein